jgi:hypothetical protein
MLISLNSYGNSKPTLASSRHNQIRKCTIFYTKKFKVVFKVPKKYVFPIPTVVHDGREFLCSELPAACINPASLSLSLSQYNGLHEQLGVTDSEYGCCPIWLRISFFPPLIVECPSI